MVPKKSYKQCRVTLDIISKVWIHKAHNVIESIDLVVLLSLKIFSISIILEIISGIFS